MKFSLFAFALFSTTVFAIGTNELTGSFDVLPQHQKVQVDARYMTGATAQGEDKSRLPASVEEKKEEVSLGTNDLTGSFE